MSAGTGVRHSEFNPSPTTGVHFLQIWIQPDTEGLAPSYDERRFSADEKRGRLRLIVSGDGAEGSLSMHQDAKLCAGVNVRTQIGMAQVELVVRVQGVARLGDGERLELKAGRDAEILVFDLPR